MKCPTHLLDDVPPTEDQLAFHGKGPHERVAGAMADLIRSSEKGGKLIGLEGVWGSGKTTVIQLMRRSLKSDRDITIFTFDAWAHERDPLRRSFLETVIRHFQKIGWVEDERWDETLSRLSHRRRLTRTRTVPHTTPFGKWLMSSALLVPLGTALVAGSLRQGVSLNFSLPVNWPFLLGAILSVAPFIVILVRYGITKWIRFQKGDTAVDGVETDSLSDWALLTGNAISETNQDTTETPEPTSIEFEDEFRVLMEVALGQTKTRKAVFVLDNLDRVGPGDALSIWSTLQTFLQDRSTEVREWFRNVWIIVPYDKSGLLRLWDARSVTATDGSGTPVEAVKESFIDKSFQIIFEVPPPVLSNWKRYLAQLVQEALPKHEKDAHDCYRSFNHCVVQKTGPPTPRQLKLYVNQIGALHRQWGHEFPLSHLAYYSALQREYTTQEEIRTALLNGDIPKRSISSMLPPDLRASVAGLLFNVEAKVGEQLLLEDPTYQYLVGGDARGLEKLRRVHGEAFWAVLEHVVTSRVREEGASAICRAAECLSESTLLGEAAAGEVQATVAAMAATARDVETWSPLTEKTVSGIGAVCRVCDDVKLSCEVLDAFRLGLGTGANRGRVALPTGIDTFVRELAGLAVQLRKLGHDEAVSQPFRLATDGQEWVESCAAIVEQDESTWVLFQCGTPISDVISVVCEKIAGGEIAKGVLATLQVTSGDGEDVDWSDVVSALERRLDPDEGVGAGEGALLVQALAVLCRRESQEAAAAVVTLVEQGYILHLLYQASSEQHTVCAAWCLVTHLRQDPSAEQYELVGDSEAGHYALEEALATDDDVLAKKVVDILADDVDGIALLWSVIDTREKYEDFLVRCLRQVADLKSASKLYRSEDIIDRWRKLREILPEEGQAGRFTSLLQRLRTDTNVVTEIQNRGFIPADAGLYVHMLKVERGGKFGRFCCAGLEELDTNEWTSQLRQEGDAVTLLLELRERGRRVSLGSSFQDALVEYAMILLSGSDSPSSNLVDKRDVMLSRLNASLRRVLRDRLLDAAIDADGQWGKGFFEIFGDEIAQPEVLRERRDVVAKLFSAMVRNRVVWGIAWLRKVLEAEPTFMESLEDKHAVVDFRDRVRQEVSKDPNADDEAGVLIRRIAVVLGVGKPEAAGGQMEDSFTEQL